jgi:predicted branched-subunit amino acid permease
MMPGTILDAARREEFARGRRDILPFSAGMIAWGLVTGVAMAKSGLSLPWALVMTLTAYAGSAQLAILPLLAGATPVWVIVMTALLTNLRFVIYSAALRRWFAAFTPSRRLALGYTTGDFSFVAFTNRVARDGEFAHRDAYYLGMCTTNWVIWQVASIVGILAAQIFPTQWGLEFAGTLALLALIVPMCRAMPALAGVLVAAAVAVVCYAWPYRLGMLLGIVLGIASAVAVESARARSATQAAS